MKKTYLLLLSVLAIPALADNNRGFYLGVGGTSINDQQEKPVDTSAILTKELIAGYKYNGALGLEVRFGASGRAGESADGSSIRDTSQYKSIYYKPELVNDVAKLYALLGYTTLTSSLNGVNDPDYSGSSYGIGIGFVINDNFNINFEYKNMCDQLYNKPNASSVNIDYRF